MTIAIEKLITPDITKPARYLGNELGAKHKPWEEVNVRWVLTYPEVYELGRLQFSHIILYKYSQHPTPSTLRSSRLICPPQI